MNKDGLEINVFCENIQPGIHLDYQTGESWIETDVQETTDIADTYIGNANSHIFHKQECGSVQDMKDKNKVLITGTREELINGGWKPCKNCNP